MAKSWDVALRRYTADELERVPVVIPDEIEACLGYVYGPVAIHRMTWYCCKGE